MRRAMTARSHRYSGGRGHVAGTHLRCQKLRKKPTGSGCLWVNLLVRGYCGVKPAGLTSSPVVVPTCLTDPIALAAVSLLTAVKLSPGFR